MYFQTPDADATAKAVEQGGGTLRVEAFDVMDAGRMTCLTDPVGAEFSVWQPAAVTGLEKTSEDHTLCWAELHTSDPSAALSFYRSLFGWRSEETEVSGMIYRVLSTADGDQEDATFGGLVQAEEDTTPRWMPYFAVADADEIVSRVQQNGGSVLMPTADVPEIGRIAWLADPFGAPFAVLKPASQSG